MKIYSEDSFFWRESRRWTYLGPSSAYNDAPPLSRISQTCARLLPSFFAICISVLLSSAGTLIPILSSFLMLASGGLYGTHPAFANSSLDGC